MNKLSIKIQSAISVGVVLFLLAILAVVGFLSNLSVGNVFNEYRETAQQTVEVEGLVEHLYETRLASLRYRINPQPAETNEVHNHLEAIHKSQTGISELFANYPDKLEVLTRVEQQATSYEEAFMETVSLQETSDKLVDEIHTLGQSIRERTGSLLETAIETSNAQKTIKMVHGEESLLLGRLNFEKFLLSNSATQLADSKSRLAEAQSLLTDVSEHAPVGFVRNESAEIAAEIGRYHSLVDQVATTIEKRNAIRQGTLDVLGPQMQESYVSLVHAIIAWQNGLGADGSSTVSTTKWFMLVFSIAAIVLGAIVALVLSNRLSSSVQNMASVMGDMSDGNYEAEVEGADNQNEIGLMARALKKFKEAATERLRLEEENAEGRRKADEARREREAIGESLNHAVELLGDGLTRLAEGDLTVKLEEPFMDSIDQLRVNFNASVEKLQHTMNEIRTNTVSIDESASEMQTAVDELSRRTEQQAASLEETSAALEQVTATVKSTSERSAEASGMASTARGSAQESSRIVSEAVEAMGRIEGASSEISNIINVIEEIAFQTNLLALNAGVEAARAGDAGKGFAVVAQEVRELAQRSAGAAKDIKTLITKSGEEVGSGVELVSATGTALETITGHVNEIASHIESIATAAKEQSSGLQEINMAVNQMDQATQNNAAMVEETTAVTHRVAEDVRNLSGQVGQFNVGSVAALAATAKAAMEMSGPAVPVADNTSTKPAEQKPVAVAGNTALKADNWDEF
ncbi:MAG: methyl-accepting chemotaxis protein [Alphaproteobacteria bacterium]|nr:methyl-accepting chemotaxis protein [Alphaproteobacteria bacterium]